jgi:hypothetical protein
MDAIYLARMKSRLVNMRKVAAIAHDPRIIELVAQTAAELEEDIRKLEAELSAAEATAAAAIQIVPLSDD